MRFFLSFFLSFIFTSVGLSQNNNKLYNDTTLSTLKLLQIQYPMINFEEDLSKISTKKIIEGISSNYIFPLKKTIDKKVIAENVKFQVAGTTYFNCKIYESKYSKKIKESITENYSELIVVKKGEILIRYQVKDLYVGGAYNRELAKIVEIPNLDLSNSIAVYPNPFKSQVILVGNKDIFTQNVEIIDITGKSVTNDFDIYILANNRVKVVSKNKLKKGVYIIKLFAEDFFVSKKLIKS